MADYIATGLADNGVKSIRVHDVSKTHISYLINDIWRYRGVVLGSCAYNLQMFPLMENLTRELLHMGVKNKLLGLFGNMFVQQLISMVRGLPDLYNQFAALIAEKTQFKLPEMNDLGGEIMMNV